MIYQEILQRSIEIGYQQSIQEGFQQGFQQAYERFARTLLQRNMSVEEVASLTGWSVDRVQNISNSLNYSGLRFEEMQ